MPWVAKAWRSVWRGIKKYGRQIASIAVLFIPGLNIYAAGFLSGMIGSNTMCSVTVAISCYRITSPSNQIFPRELRKR
jgi:hypothetical protein